MSRATHGPLSDYVRERLELIATPSGPDPLPDVERSLPDPADIPTRIVPPHQRPGGRNQLSTEHTVVTEHPAAEGAAAGPEPASGSEPQAQVRAGGVVDRLRGWGFERRHLMVLGVIAAIALVLSLYLVLRAKPVPVPAAAAVVTESAAPAVSASATPSPQQITVHVVGAVKQPGVVRLTSGARVIDAIEAAGGLTGDARPGELNLAQPVSDGQQVVIGSAATPGGQVRQPEGDGAGSGGGGSGGGGGGSGTPGPGQKLNLNNATQAQLESLPGIGPKTAEKILAWRKEHGRFTRIEELQEVPGIGAKTFAELAPHVTV
ncbi:helix-hairpin-helix domain-containing protein [Granulicoccus phenolivorans]|uniref:helix-hairpin-helix domain-containing protein n=1 Tax=Granulicoccus phenolivorans TaxID=266854 RepID=UPI0006890724|nr:helix-hairpin-helix domain-containing protein [Granulicoccus phenolivorans]